MKGRPRITKSRSKGALALAHCGHSTDQICAVLGASDAAVNYWISGEKIPSRKFRDGLKRSFGILQHWWDEPAGDGADVLAKLRPAVKTKEVAVFVPFGEGTVVPGDKFSMVTTSPDVRDAAGSLVAQCKEFMNAAQNDKLLTFTEKARVLREAATALDRAGKLTGESAEIPVSKILKSPAWTKLGKIIADAIASDEDKALAARVMRRVGEALKGAE